MHHTTRMPKVRPSSRQDEADPFPESDILKEINRVHVQYSSSGNEEYQSDSRSPSRPVTASKRDKKRISTGIEAKGHDERVPRVSSFSTRPVLQEIDAKVGDWNVVDPRTVTNLNAYKIEVIGENTRDRKGKDVLTQIFSVTGLIHLLFII
jgi:hypothetical protein